MKKLLLFLILCFNCAVSFAASPDLQDITLTSNDGTTLDFYADRSNLVVYHAADTDYIRNGTFYLGSTVSSRDGYVEAKFSIELPMSYGMKTLDGTIFYNRTTGHVSNVTLDGTVYRASQRGVVSRRR